MQEQIKHLLNCNEKTLLDQSQLNFHYFSKIFSKFLFFFFFLFTITDPIMKCSDILQWPLRKAQINYNQFLTSTSAASRQLLPILEAFVAKELLGYILFKKK